MKAYVKFGLLAGAVYLVAGLVSYMGNIEAGGAAQIVRIAAHAALAVAILHTLKERRKAQAGYLTYGQGVGSAMKTALVAASVAGIWQYIYAKFLNRESMEQLLLEMRAELENRDLGEEEMEMAEKFSRMALYPGSQAIMAFLGILFIGLIISLIVAAFVRNEDSNPFKEADDLSGRADS